MEFSKEIIAIFNYLGEKFGIAIDWTSENVMPYLKELCGRYINYEIATSIFWMIIIPVITMILVIPLAICHKKAKEANWDFNYEMMPCLALFLWVIFAIMCFVSVIVIGFQIFDIIECYTLPEKVILDYLNSLIKSAS